MGAAVRLRLDAVPAPVVARVAHRQEDRIVVAHPLPFLRLQGVLRDEDGRAGRIEAVRLDLREGTPSLIVGVVYERKTEPFAPAAREDDTLPGFGPEMTEVVQAKRRDETMSFEAPGVSPRCEVVLGEVPAVPAARPSRRAATWLRPIAWVQRAERLVDRLLAARATA